MKKHYKTWNCLRSPNKNKRYSPRGALVRPKNKHCLKQNEEKDVPREIFTEAIFPWPRKTPFAKLPNCTGPPKICCFFSVNQNGGEKKHGSKMKNRRDQSFSSCFLLPIGDIEPCGMISCGLTYALLSFLIFLFLSLGFLLARLQTNGHFSLCFAGNHEF